LLDDLRTRIVDQKLKLTRDIVDITPGMASSTTYRTRFGSLGRAFALIGHQCHASEDWLQKFRNMKSLRRKLMEDIVLASAGRVRIGYRADRRFQPCLRLNKGGRLVALVIAPHHLAYKVHPRWRIRSLPHERKLITLVARLGEANETLWDFYVIPPLGKSNYVRVCKDDPRLKSFPRLIELSQFADAVEVMSKWRRPVNWAWNEPSDTLATKQQLRRIARVSKCALIRRGINQSLLYKICRGKPVRASKLTLCLKALRKCEPAGRTARA
jgi:hypothetical protein